MIRKFVYFISMLFAIVFTSSPLWAYDGEVHFEINKAAVESSSLDFVLKNHLGIEEETEFKLEKDGKTKPIWEWIAYGGEAEDFGYYFEKDVLGTRGFNHFHDPLKNWDEAGLDSALNGFYWYRYRQYPVSVILWGLDPQRQDFLNNPTGDWSWGKAKEYYYMYLTGKDFAGNTIAVNREEREAIFADCFRAVGQVMHLLQDTSVPLHTRNDVHLPYKNFEKYVKNNIASESLDFTPDQPNDIPPMELLTNPQPDSAYSDLSPITGLFDRNQYNGDAIPSVDAAIGLAEYSNANFLTEDTMWEYPHPGLNETNYDSAVWINPEEIDAEDGEKDNRIYFRKDVGDPINHIMAASYWYYQLYMWNSPELKHAFILDEKCYADYASKLVPRAVGYSAALLDYFFRGQIEVLSLKPFSENDGLGLRVKIKNVTPTQEAMIKGDEQPFSLIWRYTPEGANLDGSEDKFSTSTYYTCREGNCDEIQYEDEVVIDFYFYWEQAAEVYQLAENQINCMLVFKGTLGSEESAVIGKNISPGKWQIESACLPLFSDNASYGLRMRIKNVTPTQETMIKGDEEPFDLICRFTPEGANPDGSEDKYVGSGANYYCREGNCDEIQYGNEVTIDFYLNWEEENRIGVQIYESAEDAVKCMLVFKGELGEEETAVVWKYFTLGQDQIKFNEEWDNGLTGNHPWEHTTADQNPDNGTTSNEIVSTDTSSNSLIKDNVRYAGYSSERFNETLVVFNDVITPYTYLQFKVDDLAITGTSWTSADLWQAMVLCFNESRYLQFYQSDQGIVMNDTTANYTFTLGANLYLNIFDLFQNSGISIPDPFYIQSINFIQIMYPQNPPIATEIHQHMEIDYIRLIEEKQEE